MCFSQPSTPSLPPAPVAPPTLADPAVQASSENETKRRLAAAGRKSTIMTSGKGLLAEAPVSKKSLMGS